ncbi:MAG: hypothetical protein HY228_01310, partial [Candidatus Yonathbacteria bacterium]|nr:hypothetical protein [Candidatus Yonathbacteria bacterium]
MQNIKDKILALSPAILFLIGTAILGSTIAGGVYIFNVAKNKCVGTACDTSTTFGTSTTSSPFHFNEPEQNPKIEDICGDNICGANEELYQNVCPRDCGGASIPPAINSFVATPNTIDAGKTVVLSWSSDAIFCAPSDTGTRWRWPGGAPKGEMVTDPLSSSQIYSITCMGKDGGMSTKSVVVSVIPPPVPKLVKEVVKNNVLVSFIAKPDTINAGKMVTLSWSSTNATSCFASGDGASWGWSGARSTKGTQITPPLASDQTYEIRCTGEKGSISKSARVTISSLMDAPTISLSVLPNTIPYGERATLAWIISDASSCTTSNSKGAPEWSGPLPSKSLFGGLKTTRPLTGDQTFTLTCVNGIGASAVTTKKEVTVLVDEASGCTTPSLGGEIQSGSSIEAYQSSSVAYGETCVSEMRKCDNGKL